MKKHSIEEFWEMMERHNRFYAWAESTADYDTLAEESRRLYHISRLSEDHTQLYIAYWTATYLHVTLENDEVQNHELPQDGMPEAA